MIKIDVNEFRNDAILLHGLEGVNETYTFYYDETNNGRKFHVEEEKFNIPVDQNFILGGLVYEGKSTNVDTAELFQSLKLQKTITDVKFKHIASGDFLDVLKSRKMNQVLKWIDSRNLYLHFTNLNPLYFSIVDIIDSAIVGSETAGAFDFAFTNHIKNDFYLVLNENIQRTEEIFFKYGYPSIDENEIVNFIDDIIELIEPYRDNEKSHLGIETTIQILKASKKTKNIPFITNEKKHILMNDYSIFYTNPLCMFKNSIHYFDQEDQIELILKNYNFIDNGRKLDHYKFINSKSSGLTQLSDIMMGFLGKLYAFIRKNSIEDIRAAMENIGDLESESLSLITKLTWKSEKKCRGFLFKSISTDEQFKEQVLLP